MFKSTTKALLAFAVTAVAWMAPASATPFPGPDAFGYSGASIAYNLRDVSATGTSAFGVATDDNVTGPVAIGFAFNFYGINYTDAYIGSNGFITFSPGQSHGCCNGGSLPGTGNPSNMVAGWFTDLTSLFPGTGSGTGGDIRYQTVGAAGSREFIVGYYENPYCCITTVTNTFEIILHETTNDIELQYGHTSADGHNRSVGIENLGGTIGLQRLFDNTSLLNLEGICISTGSVTCPAAVTADIPEPASLALVGLSLAALGMSRRRRR